MFIAFWMLMSPVFVLGSLAALSGIITPKCSECDGREFSYHGDELQFRMCENPDCGHIDSQDDD